MDKYLKLLGEKFPTEEAVCREIINLNAILNLPKGTEHFMSDLHGEYEAFYHILNNCSGVIREKVELALSDRLSEREQRNLCTLIYYPKEKLNMLKQRNETSRDWYRSKLQELIEVAKILSSKYTRSKVRKALPSEFSYIIDELLHVQKDEDDNQVLYHKKIIDTILDIDNADAFIEALASLIKRLAVDHLHIVGDIFDRGPSADQIIELLMDYHSLDIEWGNHDILWMGAACGCDACIATVIRNNVKYGNVEILEHSYGISLRNLFLFAEQYYTGESLSDRVFYAISAILFKLEGKLIRKHPEYEMDDHLHLEQINYERRSVEISGNEYEVDPTLFPTVDRAHPYELTAEEAAIVEELHLSFRSSTVLQKHIDFLYDHGSMYCVFNGNLLYHGCIPMDSDGNFEGVTVNGKTYKGKEYYDYAEELVRRGREGDRDARDFMWYLWCGRKSPLCGRNMKTFERTYLSDRETWAEEKDNYYRFYQDEKVCNMILREFGLYSDMSHVINGHTPVKIPKGEFPVRANGKLIVIDGGFCKEYHTTTGIAGYTLIFNSHGLRIKAHQPFESVKKALMDNLDIESDTEVFETESSRVMVRDTDTGKVISDEIEDLKLLLTAYRKGTIKET